MKTELVKEILGEFEASGFNAADCTGTQSCFDVLARRGNRTFVVKALANVEGLSVSSARELKRLASLLSATPLVVGERMKSSGLSRGVLYERHGLCVFNPKTLGDFLNDESPGVYSVRGNYCVRVNTRSLKKLRVGGGFTQDSLARKLGVSKQTIYRYESNGRVSLRMAEKLEGLLGLKPIAGGELSPPSMEFEEQEPGLAHITQLKQEVLDAFRCIGFRASITNAPFDMIVSENKSVYTAVSNDWRRLERKIEIINDVSEIMGGYSVCVTRRRVKHHKNVMKPRELREIKSAREFLKKLRGE